MPPALFNFDGALEGNSCARILLATGVADGALSWVRKIHVFERLRSERLCAYLRHRAPIAQIGHSLFVFDLTDDDMRRALYGPPAELEKDACVTGL
jgi:hypothetical protein